MSGFDDLILDLFHGGGKCKICDASKSSHNMGEIDGVPVGCVPGKGPGSFPHKFVPEKPPGVTS